MFEQSILVDKGLNKSWSFLASMIAELTVVSILVITPLIYGDHLPDFHWKSVTVGPAVRAVRSQPVPARRASGPVRPVFSPPRIQNPFRTSSTSELAASGPATIDVPPGIELSADVSVSGAMFFDRPMEVKPPRPVVRPPTAPSHEPIRVSQGVQMAKLIRQVVPIYPQLARNARISGVVHLVGVIAKDGTIRNLQLISGHPLLTRAAMDAVSQWVYKPTLLNGEPVEVICPIDVTFTLNP